jgi:hypothetical protein
MQAHSSLVKRPVVDWDGTALTVGWQAGSFEAALAKTLS